MIKNREKKHFLFLFFLFQTFTLLANDQKKDFQLLNRIIINIKGTDYSQRDIEIYLFTKKTLRVKKNIFPIEVHNWDGALKEFSDDFLLYQTAREIAFYGQIEYDEKKEKAFLEKIKVLRKKNTHFQKEFIAINPNLNELKIAFSTHQIIHDFIRQKDSVNRTNFYKEPKPSWFFALKENASIRFYKKARVYEKMLSLSL